MKKKIILILIIIPAFSFSQTTLEIQKAKLSAKTYLLKILNNPASYQSASWSKLTKTYSTFYETKEYRILNDSLKYYRDAQNKTGILARRAKLDKILSYQTDSSYKYYHNLEIQVDSAIKAITNTLEIKEKSFKPIFDGYTIDHSFRARNKFNALVINNYFFNFNKLFKVISSGDSDELDQKRQQLQAEIDELINRNSRN